MTENVSTANRPQKKEDHVLKSFKPTFKKPIFMDFEEALDLVGVGSEYEIEPMLRQFQNEFYHLISTKRTKELRKLTDAKTTLLRLKIIEMISKSENNSFDLEGKIPFETTCVDCKGLGEIINFYKGEEEVECESCKGKGHNGQSTGYILKPCLSCNETGYYTKTVGNKTVSVECIKCFRDEEGKATGKRSFKCRACRGTTVFRKKILLPDIRTVTHCKTCKGRGFIQPEYMFSKKRPKKRPDNPVISEDIAMKIKEASIRPE